MNREQIERHLAGAIAQATPNVLDGILAGDYQQDKVQTSERGVISFRGFKRFSGLIAACILLLVFTGGYFGYGFHYRISSVIEIDVNPSIELSVSGSGRVISARAANEDGIAILDGMELKGVDLNVAVNAILGSMVNHGYFDRQENSILVSVSNQSPQKADRIRKELVTNIEDCLAEQQVTAVVFDQKVNPTDQLLELAERYGISYGKANFIQKLIEKDSSLTMEALAPLSMDAIANLIQEKEIDISDLEEYEYGSKVAEGLGEKEEPSGSISTWEPLEESVSSDSDVTNTESSASAEVSGSSEEETAKNQTVVHESQEEPESKPVTIGLITFENHTLRVEFNGKVKWKNPAVSVKDAFGEYYPVKLEGIYDDLCEVLVYGLTSEGQYTITISGVKNKEGKNYETVTGSLSVTPEEAIYPGSTDQTLETKEESVPPRPETTASPTGASNASETEEEVPKKAGDKTRFLETEAQITQNAAKVSALTREGDNFSLTLSEPVDWADAAVTLSDDKGNSYTAAILEAQERKCVLAAQELQCGRTYTLTVSGMVHADSGRPSKVVIYFSIMN